MPLPRLLRRLLRVCFGLVLACAAVEGVAWGVERASDAVLYFDRGQRFGLRHWDAPGHRVSSPAGGADGRVVVLGDSVTYGIGLTFHGAPWPEQMAARLHSAVTVENRSVPGYDIAAIAGQIRDEILPDPPALIVYGWFINDVAPTQLLNLGGSALWVSPAPPPFTTFSPAADAMLHRWSAAYRRYEGLRAARSSASAGPPDFAWFEAEATRMLAEVAAAKASLLVVVLPPHVLNAAGNGACDARARQQPGFCGVSRAEYERGLAWFRGRGVPTYGALEAYLAGGDADLSAFPGDPNHPNDEGHRRLAEAVAPLVDAQLAAH